MFDVIIIGGGPAAAAAAVYTGRKRLNTLLITEEFGGQSVVSDNIENWIGTKTVTGLKLAEMFEQHIRTQETVEIRSPERASKVIEINGHGFEVETDQGKYPTQTVLVTTGGRRRKLNVPGEVEFSGKGVAYCSTCDAPLFKGKNVAVIGGGNAGLEAVVDLFPYATQIYLLHRGDALKGDPLTQEEIRKNSKVAIMLNTETQEVLGEKFVKSLRFKNNKTSEVKQIEVEGVFVEIGSVPNSEIVKGLVELNQFGEIIIDHKTGRTSKSGIWAAGDVTDDPYKQNNISAGDAVKAALNIYEYVSKMTKTSPAAEMAHI